jgi:DNA ligase-1
LLANILRDDVDLSKYWVSEKYDGIRAYWNGRELVTRNGHIVSSPHWFTAKLPGVPLDGELWAGRGHFEALGRTVRDAIADDAAWRAVRFMVFDLPAHPGTFDQRLAALERLQLVAPAQAVHQFRIADRTSLARKLREIVDAGGEGLMLHRGDSHYRAGRSDDLLKLKPVLDAEARVVGYLPGKGKYEGMMGALRVERADGLQFLLGTGFSDALRCNPPAIGSWVTYSFTSLTAKGKPRFARFVRMAAADQPSSSSTRQTTPPRSCPRPSIR